MYLPPLRVALDRWCEWTGASWSKVSSITGNSFRMPSRRESAYTMAANAALALIQRYDIDPNRVGMLALGTESSTDNAAGAVIVRGMLDQALSRAGLPTIAQSCEVPEVKHACLGGIYALKNAARYVAFDGADKVAIVISVDVAEYARGSSGEQTQGAGAVAMLVEATPRLLELQLDRAGSSSSYRGLDFRKPTARFFMEGYGSGQGHDFPVFNGRYSTYCYLDQTIRAFREMSARMGVDAAQVMENASALFFHRPYHYMPIQGLSALYVLALEASDPKALETLACEAGTTIETIRAELDMPAWDGTAIGEADLAKDPTPGLTAVARLARRTDGFRALIEDKLSLGQEAMKSCGNMYTAALPAWLAAGFDDALERGVDLTDTTVLAMGYGSGDAAEAIPMRVVEGWKEAAARIEFGASLGGAIDLDQAQYEALHGGQDIAALTEVPSKGFVIDSVGVENRGDFQSIGVEFYDHLG